MTDISAVGQFAWLLLVLPLAGAVILLLAGKAANKWGHLLGCATVLAAFVYGVILFFDTTNTGIAPKDFIPKLLEKGVRTGFISRRVRVVTHLDVSREDCARAVEIIRKLVA